MTHKPTVLVVDDDPLIHKLVSVRIRELNAAVVCASGPEEGIELAHSVRPQLILLDVDMPGMSGFDVCARLRDDPLTREIPVIFLTGTDDSDVKVRAFEMGAVDYVTKPFNAGELRARVRAALRMQSLLAALEVQARTDVLTGLPNRQAFQHAVARCIERARQQEENYQFALLFLDLDRFKIINDSLGHGVGDELLINVANKLYNCVRCGAQEPVGRDQDIVARMGGDEFAVLLHDVKNLDMVCEIAERIRLKASESVNIEGYEVHCGASVGVRICDQTSEDADALLRDSDTAMYHAKDAGKGCVSVFDDRMREQVVNRLQLETDLRQAVSNRQLELVFQPMIDINDHRVRGFEALVRWNHPERGVVMPDVFIPIAEETGLIHDIGRWVLRNACMHLREWIRTHDTNFHISVNLSKAQLGSDDLSEHVRQVIEDFGLDPKLLLLEVTESVIMHESRLVAPILEQLHNLGVQFAMDDFGTGQSSLACLHRFPLDVLKIDRSFVQRLENNRPYAAIVHAIITLAHNLDLTVVAEGVESDDQLVTLQALECDFAQGFLLSHPLAGGDVNSFIKTNLARYPVAV